MSARDDYPFERFGIDRSGLDVPTAALLQYVLMCAEIDRLRSQVITDNVTGKVEARP